MALQRCPYLFLRVLRAYSSQDDPSGAYPSPVTGTLSGNPYLTAFQRARETSDRWIPATIRPKRISVRLAQSPSAGGPGRGEKSNQCSFLWNLVVGKNLAVVNDRINHPFVPAESVRTLANLRGLGARHFLNEYARTPPIIPSVVIGTGFENLPGLVLLSLCERPSDCVVTILAAPLAIPRGTVRHSQREADNHLRLSAHIGSVKSLQIILSEYFSLAITKLNVLQPYP